MSIRSRALLALGIFTAVHALFFAVLGPRLRTVPGEIPIWLAHGYPFNPAAAYVLAWMIGFWAGGLAAVLALRARQALSPGAAVAIGLGAVALIAGIRLHFRFETMPIDEAIALPLADVLATGGRLPLGLLLGSIVAVGTAACLGVGWREVGDAWAVGVSVLIPIGRMGCMTAGCCFGAICEHWPSWLCVRHPPGTLAYSWQVNTGTLPLGQALSLPMHPLPLYFALASLLTLAGLVWLLRRGAAPGSLLLCFAIVRPASKLALEQLRADVRPGILMTAIPATVLVGTLTTLALVRWRASHRRTALWAPPLA